VVFTAGNRRVIAAAKSLKEARLNYTMQSFGRHFFDAISTVQLLAANTLYNIYEYLTT